MNIFKIMIKFKVSSTENNNLPSSTEYKVEDGKIYAIIDIKKCFKDGAMIKAEWENPGSDYKTDICLGYIHASDDPMYSGSNFIYFLKGSFVDYTRPGTNSKYNTDAERVWHDFLGIPESSVVYISEVSEYEAKYLNKCLADCMMKYDENVNKIVPFKFVPKEGESYWYIRNVIGMTDNGLEINPYYSFAHTKHNKDDEVYDRITKNCSVVYPSKSAADEACRRLNIAVNKVIDDIKTGTY